MKYAVVLAYDNESQQKVSTVKTLLTQNGIEEDQYKTNHITVADAEINNFETLDRFVGAIYQYSRGAKACEIEFCTASAFTGASNVLFLAPTVTEELRLFNVDFSLLMPKIGLKVQPYYVPVNWFPHNTLALGLNDEQLQKGLALVNSKGNLPIKVNVNKIVLVRYDKVPYNEIAQFELQK